MATAKASIPERFRLTRAKAATGDFAPWPHFDKDEIDAAAHVLASGKVNYWTGTEGREFEKEFANHTGTRHAIALANGSVALELALKTLGIAPGDEIITTPRTFVASASSAIAVGARPVFADVDRTSGNITAASIREVVTAATKAIIPVHLGGWPCEMDEIMSLAREFGLKVVEDCAQAHGAMYRGRAAGGIGDIGSHSFCQDKIMTTAGEGGMITLNDEAMFEKAWAYKDHGKSYDAVYRRSHPIGFRWLHESFGTNWRLTEVQSAIGRLQLRKLHRWVSARRTNAARLTDCFAALPGLRVTTPPDHIFHSYYKYYVHVRPEALGPGWSRDRILEQINARGVPCFAGSCSEVYLEKAFPQEMRPANRLPVARELGETSLTFLVHPTLEPGSLALTCEVVEEVMYEATR
jgi:dTDP-4-amino-4,6-dideoxygalactose transaminase